MAVDPGGAVARVLGLSEVGTLPVALFAVHALVAALFVAFGVLSALDGYFPRGAVALLTGGLVGLVGRSRGSSPGENDRREGPRHVSAPVNRRRI